MMNSIGTSKWSVLGEVSLLATIHNEVLNINKRVWKIKAALRVKIFMVPSATGNLNEG